MSPRRSVFSQHPLAQLAVAFAAGVCAAHSVSLPIGGSSRVWCVQRSIVVLVLKKKLRAAGLVLLFAMFFVGAVLAELETC